MYVTWIVSLLFELLQILQQRAKHFSHCVLVEISLIWKGVSRSVFGHQESHHIHSPENAGYSLTVLANKYKHYGNDAHVSVNSASL